jgi:regulator of cell morphogenesis and NO signaling
MKVDLQTKVGDLVKIRPEAMRYFEGLGIDYCCGGQQSLAEACSAANLAPQKVLEDLEKLPAQPAGTPSAGDWENASLTDLTEHLKASHHAYLRTELPRLGNLASKVLEVHGARHVELAKIHDLFQALEADLLPHLMKEEQILFPFIQGMEQGQAGGACFGTVQSPIRVMEREHEAVGAMLAELRRLTAGYQIPMDGCTTFQALYQGLAGLEADTHLHIFLENQILHPRAIAMEASVRA